MKYKFNIGDTVYVSSRYDGIVKRVITEQVVSGDMPSYIFDIVVQFNKDGSSLGAKRKTFEDDYGTKINYYPCPEEVIMQIGDNIVYTGFLEFGEVDKNLILTINMVNLDD